MQEFTFYNSEGISRVHQGNFKKSGRLVFGEETAIQAFQRFNKAIQALILNHPDKNIVVVSHGTVISLFTCHYCQMEPFAFW